MVIPTIHESAQDGGLLGAVVALSIPFHVADAPSLLRVHLHAVELQGEGDRLRQLIGSSPVLLGFAFESTNHNARGTITVDFGTMPGHQLNIAK